MQGSSSPSDSMWGPGPSKANMGPGIRAVSQETPFWAWGPGGCPRWWGGMMLGGGAGQIVPSRTTPGRRSRAPPRAPEGLPAEKPPVQGRTPQLGRRPEGVCSGCSPGTTPPFSL